MGERLKRLTARKERNLPMADGITKEHRHDESRTGGDKEENKNHNNCAEKMAHDSPQEYPGDPGDSESPSVVVNGGGNDKENVEGCNNESCSSASTMAKGLSDLISSVMQDYDSRAEATISSQNQLAFALDRLTGELDQLLDDAPLPFIMQHAARISGVRKRVKSLNLVLKTIQRRVDNIDRTLSAGLMQGNSVPNI